MSLCNYTPQKTFIPVLFTERDERRERQRHVIAPLPERGVEEQRDTENGRTKGWWWGFNKPPLSLVYTHTHTHRVPD